MKTLMTIDDVAAELNVKPLAVKRVIALRALNATTVGGDQVRVIPDELQSYISQGAPRLQMPKVGEDGWFVPPGDFNDLVTMDMTLRQMIKAAAPVDAPAKAKSGFSTDIDISPPADMLALLKQPARQPSPFKTNADWYAAVKLWRTLFELTNSPNLPSRLNLLSSSPTAFTQFTDQAWTSFQSVQP